MCTALHNKALAVDPPGGCGPETVEAFYEGPLPLRCANVAHSPGTVRVKHFRSSYRSLSDGVRRIHLLQSARLLSSYDDYEYLNVALQMRYSRQGGLSDAKGRAGRDAAGCLSRLWRSATDLR
jgi:hypothetical protein